MNPESKRYEFGFNKRLVTALPGPSVADNFTELVNLRYTDTGVQSVRGMELMNSTALDGDVLSAGNFINENSGENYILTHALTDSDGGEIFKSSSPEYDVHTSFDLSTAQFYDEKRSVTTFTVDTANTSGHFDAAVSARIRAGCRIVISGTNYTVISISGDGTSSNSVVFSGTLTTGAKTVSGIYGCEVDVTDLRLSRYRTADTATCIPALTGYTSGSITVAASNEYTTYAAWKAFDRTDGTSEWLVQVAGPWWLRVDFGSGNTKTLSGYGIKGPTYSAHVVDGPKSWTFEGSNNGTDWTVLDTRTNEAAWTLGLVRNYSLSAPVSYRYFRLNISASQDTGITIGEFMLYATLDTVPVNVVYPALLSVDCTDWTALKALARTETLNSQFIWYALSFDGGTTYSAFVSGAWRPIVRNNAGTWQYWTGSAWAASSINSALVAMIMGVGAVAGNRMTGAAMAGLTQAQINGSGGFTGGRTSLPVLLALYSTSATATPLLSALDFVSDIQEDSGNFDPTALYTCATGALTSRFSLAPQGAVAVCNGIESLIYAGKEAIIGSFVGYDSTVYYDYTEQIRNRVNDAENSAYIPSVATPIVYIGATRPVQGFKLYIGSANAVAATVAVRYWDGNSFELVSNAVDNTAISGATLAVTGTISFDDTQSVAQPSLINGVMLYWYKLTFSTTLTSTTRVYHAVVDSPMQPIRDLWDGDPRTIGGYFKYTTGYLEYTGNVYENVYDSSDGGTFVNVGGLTTSQYIYAGFPEKIIGLSVSIYGGGGNTTASTLTVSYWDGDSWASVSGLVDGTKDSGGTKTHAQSGVISWNPPATQFEKPLVKDLSLYFYRLSVSATLSATVDVFYVTGIPEAQDIGGHSFPLYANGRLWLLDEYNANRNQAVCSAQDAPDVFNGKDSLTFTFGGSDPLMGGAPLFTQFGSSLYNMTVFFKRSEIWAVIGSSPEDWTQFRISSSTGCCAPGTICTATINAPGNPAQNQHILFFQSEDGVYLFDGRTPVKISGDIKNYFVQTNPEAIQASMLASSGGFYDYRNDEYHLLIASGPSATTLNVELVYDLRRNKWFEIERPTDKKIQIGFVSQGDEGFRRYYGASGGSFYALESGQNFAGEDIDWSLATGDISLAGGSVSASTVLHGVRLVGGAHENACDVDVTLYADGNETGTEILSGFDLQNSGSRIVLADINGMRVGQRAVYHAIKLSGSVCDEEGIDLYGLGIEYREAR